MVVSAGHISSHTGHTFTCSDTLSPAGNCPICNAPNDHDIVIIYTAAGCYRHRTWRSAWSAYGRDADTVDARFHPDAVGTIRRAKEPFLRPDTTNSACPDSSESSCPDIKRTRADIPDSRLGLVFGVSPKPPLRATVFIRLSIKRRRSLGKCGPRSGSPVGQCRGTRPAVAVARSR